MPRRKKGAGLNEHIENYIEEEKILDQIKTF